MPYVHVQRRKYTWPGSNWRPSACEADVIATRPQVLADRCLQAKTHCNNLTPCPVYQPVEASSESISPYRRSVTVYFGLASYGFVRNGLRGMTTAGHRPCWSHAGRTRDPARHNGAHAMQSARHVMTHSTPHLPTAQSPHARNLPAFPYVTL